VVIIPGITSGPNSPLTSSPACGASNVLDRPKSLLLHLEWVFGRGCRIPFIREDSKRTFLKALDDTEYDDLRCDLNFLVVHQTFDEAT